MNMVAPVQLSRNLSSVGASPADRQALVMIVSDTPHTVDRLEEVCGFFDLGVQVVAGDDTLLTSLREHRPMAVITDVEAGEQDGFHIMRMVALYDRDLPVMVLTHGDPILMGAADATQELCDLTMVCRTTAKPLAGQIAEFLFVAGRRAGCMRLVQV
ncbi:hypothetical protein [Rhodopila sp.]|uniref:hypothetical protein n=1 Tax=Rhodopila sp. TaxID=2480087 RepID=UPI002B5EC3F8|nr:hypothetical protein [Rhodopila sp.]HVZ07337.1 hypothetical protein [Rhodopila sp.]